MGMWQSTLLPLHRGHAALHGSKAFMFLKKCINFFTFKWKTQETMSCLSVVCCSTNNSFCISGQSGLQVNLMKSSGFPCCLAYYAISSWVFSCIYHAEHVTDKGRITCWPIFTTLTSATDWIVSELYLSSERSLWNVIFSGYCEWMLASLKSFWLLCWRRTGWTNSYSNAKQHYDSRIISLKA